MANVNNEIEFKFFKGNQEFVDGKSEDAIKRTRAEITTALNAMNISFLLGAGCSSLKDKSREIGIPTMAELASEFSEQGDWSDCWNKAKEYKIERCTDNLETLMQKLGGVLAFEPKNIEIKRCVDEVKSFLFEKVFGDGEFEELRKTYEHFYRCIFFRDKTLSRPWVATTNYDLLNELSLDSLSMPFCNGFSGGIERRFNPATFGLTLARQLEISSGKWEAVENFVYLCKLHGSISWQRDTKNAIWPFIESYPSTDTNNVEKTMIYPSPAKQGESLTSPYSDLFRLFQGQVVQNQSVLFVIGYSFSDEHINNIIYQALTIPSFRLVIFANPNSPQGPISKLKTLNDKRIWIIGGNELSGDASHYFESVVENFLPEQPKEEIQKATENVIATIGKLKLTSEKK